MRLEPELKDWLETEARRQDRSAAYLAKQAISQMKAQTEAKHRVITLALQEADKGVFISEESMNAWMDSWDTENELPAPMPDVFPHRA